MKESIRLMLPGIVLLITLPAPGIAVAQTQRHDIVTPVVEFRFTPTDQSQSALPISSTAESTLKLSLNAADADKVRFDSKGITLKKGAILKTAGQPVNQRIQAANQLSVEAWIRPASLNQKGPARILTLSRDSSNRNFTLGQQDKEFEIRLRTTNSTDNGLPQLSTSSKVVSTEFTHVVFTRSHNGTNIIYVNGKKAAKIEAAGKLSNWNNGYQLAIGDELSGDRSWQGTVAMVAIFDLAISEETIVERFRQGPTGRPNPELIAKREAARAAHHFETKIAPLLSNHCLECHDSATREGELDLSRRQTIFQLTESGQPVFKGNAEKSLVWLSVEDDSMPHDRPALTTEEKKLLKDWIEDGATFSLTQIDPAIYQHSGGEQRWIQRLTVDEYIQTVKSVTGINIEQEARQLLPADLRADGFSNTSYNLNVGLKHVDAWSKLAETIVSRMDVLPFVKRFSNRNKFTDKDMADVISKMGEWVLRGPVSNEEIVAYRGITTSVASAGGDFEEAMQLLLEAMLQSPRFLYRIESQPTAGRSQPVEPYELASRLSYIIWGAPPDEQLLQAARLGSIDIREQARRMLKSPLANQQAIRFVEDWLNLKRLQNLQPNTKRFPMWTAELSGDMRSETRRYAQHVLWDQKLPLVRLLNTQKTFATDRLANFYGLPDDAQTAHPESETYNLTSVNGRGGLLTQGSILTVGGDDASMVTRGLLVMHELLRGVVKDPPPCVDTTPVPTEPGITQRSIALQRIADSSCGGCHSKFEPLAFGLEKFDGIGRYHEQDEHGNQLRDDGEILFPGTSAAVEFQSSEELMNLLAESDRVKQSLTWKVTQFALGRPLAAEDASAVDQIHRQATENGGTWHATIEAIVTSDLVTMK